MRSSTSSGRTHHFSPLVMRSFVLYDLPDKGWHFLMIHSRLIYLTLSERFYPQLCPNFLRLSAYTPPHLMTSFPRPDHQTGTNNPLSKDFFLLNCLFSLFNPLRPQPQKPWVITGGGGVFYSLIGFQSFWVESGVGIFILYYYSWEQLNR